MRCRTPEQQLMHSLDEQMLWITIMIMGTEHSNNDHMSYLPIHIITRPSLAGRGVHYVNNDIFLTTRHDTFHDGCQYVIIYNHINRKICASMGPNEAVSA